MAKEKSDNEGLFEEMLKDMKQESEEFSDVSIKEEPVSVEDFDGESCVNGVGDFHAVYLKMYQCEKCEYTTGEELLLKMHSETHISPDEKVYKCKNCSYTSTRRSNYNDHLLTHTGTRPFKCDKCDYSATRKDRLRCHLLTHSGEKPFKCDKCDYSSTRKVQT
ncbi:RE1-silencing transcription factor [Armadillidium vulgare]|nr:RE1-silencing transcription factor [Armadillidium vulgare]